MPYHAEVHRKRNRSPQLKILFYLYPGLLPQGPDFNGGWTWVLAGLAKTLGETGSGRYVIVTASRFAHHATSSSEQVELRLIDETALHVDVREIAPSSSTLTALAELARTQTDESHPAIALLNERVRNACNDFEPDLIVTVGMEAKYLRSIWPDAPILNVEAGAFSRSPFPFSLYFDHIGMYQSSAIPLLSSGISAIDNASPLQHFVEDFRAWTLSALTEANPFKDHDYRSRFERLALLPLQVSNYYSFDDQCNYRTQFEYLFDVVSAAPKGVGLIATEYVHWGAVFDPSHSGSNLDFLRKTFPNVVIAECARKYTSSSQYLCPHVDGVWSVSSNVGYQALLLGKRLGSPAQTHYHGLAHDHTPKDFFSSLTADAPTEDRLPFLAWYLENYLVPGKLLGDPRWLYEYLSQRRTAILAAKNPLDGFIPLGSPGAIRDAWDISRATEAAARWTNRESKLLQRLAKANSLLTECQAEPPCSVLQDANQCNDAAPAYVVLSGAHNGVPFGSDLVAQFFQNKLAEVGLRCLGFAHNAHDSAALLSAPKASVVKLVVLNAEGLSIRDNEQFQSLIDFASEMKERSASLVLINANASESDEIMGPLLELFDRVTLRHSNKLGPTRHWHEEASWVPDISLAAFKKAASGHSGTRDEDGAYPLAIVEGFTANTKPALSDFAEFHHLPYYLMDNTHIDPIVNDQGTAYELGDFVFPRILRFPSELYGSKACLTGHYQGLSAALAIGVPVFCPLFDDLADIHRLIDDAGIGAQALLSREWLECGHVGKLAELEALLQDWSPAAIQSAKLWVNSAIDRIEEFFTELKGLAVVNSQSGLTN